MEQSNFTPRPRRCRVCGRPTTAASALCTPCWSKSKPVQLELPLITVETSPPTLLSREVQHG